MNLYAVLVSCILVFGLYLQENSDMPVSRFEQQANVIVSRQLNQTELRITENICIKLEAY